MLKPIESLEELAKLEGPLHLALGVFDGVHVGHQALIRKAIEAAREDRGKAIVVTFTPHPIEIIAPQKAPKSLLAGLAQKAALLEEIGVYGLLAIPFDHAFSQVEAERFLDLLTLGEVKTIAVGEDWRFGYQRAGDVKLLRKMAKQKGFVLEAIDPVLWLGERISSSRIREAIAQDQLHLAEEMLGRPYEVCSRVIPGKKMGRILGFPTANLMIDRFQTPSNGVWIVKVNGEKKGVANLGLRPTVQGTERLLEVHLLDENQDLYGQELRIRFLRKVREEAKFNSLEELKEQIQRDVKVARAFFKI